MNEASERKVWFGLNDDPCDGGFYYLAHESELDELLADCKEYGTDVERSALRALDPDELIDFEVDPNELAALPEWSLWPLVDKPRFFQPIEKFDEDEVRLCREYNSELAHADDDDHGEYPDYALRIRIRASEIVRHYERCPQLVMFPAATGEEEGE